MSKDDELTGQALIDAMCADKEFVRLTEEGYRALDEGRVISLEDFKKKLEARDQARLDEKVIARAAHIIVDRNKK